MLLFGLFSLILVLVFWVNKAVSLLDVMMGDGQSIAAFLKITSLGLPILIADVLPITAFIAAVFAINRMSSESELIVVQAAGFSPWRLARPVLAFGIIAALMIASVTHVLSPMAQQELSTKQAELSRDVTARLLTEGTFVHPVAGITFYVREIPPSGELLDVYLSDSRGTELRTNFLARRALIVKDDDAPVLLMFDGESQSYDVQSKKLAVTTFDSFAYSLAELFGATTTKTRQLRAITTPEMITSFSSVMAESGSSRADLHKIIHERTQEALLAMVAPLIGFAALIAGGFSRFGLWRQIFLAFGLLIFVKSVDSAAISAIRSAPDNWPLLYLPILAGLAVTGVLLWYASNPNILRRTPKIMAGDEQ